MLTFHFEIDPTKMDAARKIAEDAGAENVEFETWEAPKPGAEIIFETTDLIADQIFEAVKNL